MRPDSQRDFVKLRLLPVSSPIHITRKAKIVPYGQVKSGRKG